MIEVGVRWAIGHGEVIVESLDRAEELGAAGVLPRDVLKALRDHFAAGGEAVRFRPLIVLPPKLPVYVAAPSTSLWEARTAMRLLDASRWLRNVYDWTEGRERQPRHDSDVPAPERLRMAAACLERLTHAGALILINGESRGAYYEAGVVAGLRATGARIIVVSVGRVDSIFAQPGPGPYHPDLHAASVLEAVHALEGISEKISKGEKVLAPCGLPD